MSDIQKIIEEIEKLNLLEVSELVKALEEKFSISAAMPQMAAGAVSGANAAGPEAEEKSEFDVILTAFGEKKIDVIKAVRELKPDLGLKDAKDLVEGAPKPVLIAVKKEVAEEAKKKLETAGAKVELK